MYKNEKSYANDKMCINVIAHKKILITIYNKVLIVNIS